MITWKKAVFKVLGRRKDLMRFWEECLFRAEEEGAAFPREIAWIYFREVYTETEDGWTER